MAHELSPESALLFAVKFNSVSSVALLFEKKVNVSAKNRYGRNALHVAASQDAIWMVQKLLTQDSSNAIATDNDGAIPLHLASAAGRTSVVELLIDKTSLEAKDRFGATPLHHAATGPHSAVLDLLIAAGANIFAKDNQGVTPLEVIPNGEIPLQIQTLDQFIGRVIKKYDDLPVGGRQPAEGGSPSMFKLGVSSIEGDVRRQITNFERAGAWEAMSLTRAIRLKQDNWARTLLCMDAANANATEGTGRNEQPCLHLSLKARNKRMTMFLLQCNADSNMRDGTGATALHITAENRWEDEMELILSYGANPDIKEFRFGWTPLHQCAKDQFKEGIELALRFDASPDIRDKTERTALHIALGSPYFGRDTKDIIRLLLEAGASMNIPDNHGQTALELAGAKADKPILDIIANHLMNQKFELSIQSSPTSEGASLRVHFPFSLSSPGLCKSIYDRVDDFYLHLTKLKNPGFALGLDIAPSDGFITSPTDLELFTGISSS